jgi:hypothetical protein
VDDLPKFLTTLRAKLKVGWLSSRRHVMAEGALESARLVRWCGLAPVAGGVLLAVATPLHPTQERATTIIASEVRLVASHALSTLSSLLIMFGLPGLYLAHRRGMGRLGVAGFLGAWSGTHLIAVSGNFGFLAPVLAKESPAVIDPLLNYPPVVGLNGFAVIGFVAGYAVFGIAIIRSGSIPRAAGILVAMGAPAYLLGAGIAQLVSPAVWTVAVLGSVSLGVGLAWPGYRLWQPVRTSP